MTDVERYPRYELTKEDRDTLLASGVDLRGYELDPLEGARGHHVAVWIDDDIAIEFMTSADAPIENIVRTLHRNLVEAAADVGAQSVVVAAVEVMILKGRVEFGTETARAKWFGEPT